MFSPRKVDSRQGRAPHSGRQQAEWCRRGGKVVVVGGGPAGAFFAIHLLRKAALMRVPVEVTVIERQWQGPVAGGDNPGSWKGCNHCAGGVSPRLFDVLESLDLRLPEELVQSQIRSITIQGYWKNIELEVPPGRRMASVYRGSQPACRADRHLTFDSFLIERARAAGAHVVGGEVRDVGRSDTGLPVVSYTGPEGDQKVTADFVVVAAGLNEGGCAGSGGAGMAQALQRLIPGYQGPRVRRALIFEMETMSALPPALQGQVHFVEYGSRALPLEMCSLVPKDGFITVVLVGPCVDALPHRAAAWDVMRQFLDLPHIRKLLSSQVQPRVVCACTPSLVVGTARHPFGDRVAAVGDMVTARLYKDGILSAHWTAQALADTILTRGVDLGSLEAGYGPVIQRFRRDNRFAALVFLLHRIVFSSSFFSRVVYQAVLTERKGKLIHQRRLGRLLWLIASGDDVYKRILLAMLHPATIASILFGGLLVTLRNMGTELLFGLSWEGFGRFTTGVAKEGLEAKRAAFTRLLRDLEVESPPVLEFERMYTIRIFAPANRVMDQLGRFGETERRYLRPRWVRIRRVAGMPNRPGCTIRYFIGTRHCSFGLRLEKRDGERLAVYRVLDGFARGGVLIFEVEKRGQESCDLSIYVAFSFHRGRSWLTRPFWWALRSLFPAFVHDVLWNHSLCTLKDLVETEHQEVSSQVSSRFGQASPDGLLVG